MNTIPFPPNVKANLAKYNLINTRARRVLKRGFRLTKNEVQSINQGYTFGNSDLRLVPVK